MRYPPPPPLILLSIIAQCRFQRQRRAVLLVQQKLKRTMPEQPDFHTGNYVLPPHFFNIFFSFYGIIFILAKVHMFFMR